MPDNLFRRGEIWWGRITVDGRERRGSLRTSNRAEAKKRLKVWLEKVSHIAFYGDERRRWPAAVLKYTTEVLAHSVKSSTATRYLVSLRQVYPILKDKFLDEIDRKEVARVVSERLRAGATNATIRRDLTAVSRVLAACEAWGWREGNPARDYDRSVIRERRDPVRLPDSDELDAAIALVPVAIGRIMRLAAQTGMREAEIVTLDHSQVDYARKTIALTKTKTDSPRVIPLTGPITDAAVGTITGTARHIRTNLIFWHGDGEAYKNFASNFTQQKRRHDIKFRFHDLRHKFAVDYLRAGGNIYDLQQIMGHSSIKTTEIYLKFLTPDEAAAAKRTAQKTAQV